MVRSTTAVTSDLTSPALALVALTRPDPLSPRATRTGSDPGRPTVHSSRAMRSSSAC